MMIDQFAQLLVTSLTGSELFDVQKLLSIASRQATLSEPTSRMWVAAVRRVEDEGHLTAEYADAIVLELAFSSTRGRAERLEWLTEVGERQLARRVREREKDLVPWMIHRVNALVRETREAHPEWKAGCRPWDGDEGTTPAAPRGSRRSRIDELYDRELAERVEQWRRAAKGEGGWTMAVALQFKYFVALENRQGEGALEISAVQRARAEGVMDVNLSWLALDTIAGAMVAPTPNTSEEAWDQWMVSEEARERRATVFKRRVLEAVGEVEMVRVMTTRPQEFRRRIELAEGEWVV